jgi:hypothetical protein
MMTDARETQGATSADEAADATPSIVAPARSSTDASLNAADWRAALPEELRRPAEKFASPADVVRSYAALERRLGRSVTIPGEDAAPEEIEAFYTRLGRPPTPDGYRIAAPPGDAGDEAARSRLAGFLAAVHAAGAPQATVQAAIDWYRQEPAEAAAESARRADAARAEADAALRREWGAGYDRRLGLAQRALRHFGGAELAAMLDRGGFGNEPAWLRACARIGAALAEVSLVSGGAAGGDAQARIDAIMTAHFGKPSYSSAAVQNELRALYQSLYGDGPPRPDAV